MSYDELNRLLTTTDALGGTTAFAYDANGNLTGVTDANEHTTTMTYDELNRLTSRLDALGAVTRFVYDANSNRTTVVDAHDNTTLTDYDALNRPTQITDALDGIAAFTYDLAGNLIAQTDANEHTTRYDYDALNRLVQRTDALGGVTKFAYDPVGRLVGVTDANNHSATNSYDLLGRLVSTSDPLERTTHLSYDAVGNLIQTIDPRGGVSRFSYDDLDRLIQAGNPNEETTRYAYDPVGNLTTVTNPRSYPTRYEYDELNRLSRVIDALDGATAYTYDAVGNLTGQTDANSHTTQFSYDARNRLLGEIDPLGNTWGYTYDLLGNLVARTDAKGAMTTYSYDALNRRTATSYPDSSGVSFGYDAVGNLTSINNATQGLLARYDEVNRLAAIGPSASAIGYAYDPVGNLTAITYPSSDVVSYAYDAANQQVSMTDPAGQVTGYAYDLNGNLTQTDYPNQVRSSYSYDPANRLVGLTHTDTARNKLLYGNTLTYDPAGNVTAMVERFEQGVTRTTDHTYTYDPLDRLAQEIARQTWSSGERITRDYSYDAVGNRLLEAIQTVASNGKTTSTSTAYSYDAADQLAQAGNTTFQYDANGNRTEATSSSLVEQYGYDFENRLTDYTRLIPQSNGKLKEDLTAAYAYDGLGRRVLESVTNSGQAKEIRTKYDGFSYNPLVAASTPGQTANLYYGVGSLVASREVQSGGNGSIYYRQPNWRGDVALSTNQSGGSAHQYFYSPYGRLLDNNSKLLDSSNFTGPHNRYTLSGKPLDAESGLTYFGARYYDAANGVWLTRDPVQGALNDPTSRHPYLFNRANPIRFTDPFGAYVVQPGDTLWDIASQYSGSGTNWSALYVFNLNVVGGNPNLIYPGQDLYIPWGEIPGGWDPGSGAPPPPPPPLSNAKALCDNGIAKGWLPSGMINWCALVVGGDIVSPLPVDFSQQILNSQFVQSLFGIAGTSDLLKPRALTQSGDCQNPQSLADDIKCLLDEFNTEVIIADPGVYRTVSYTRLLFSVYASVYSIGYRFYTALNPAAAYPETSKVATAFTSVFRGAHTITIASDRQDACKDPSTGKTDWNCTRGDLDTGAEMYLRAQDLGQAGLIFHEFGHLFTNSATRDARGNLTSTPDEFNDDPSTYDFLKAIDPTQAILQQKVPNWSVKRIAQEIANNNFVSYSGDPDYYLRNAEATADAFAAWIMRDFTQQKESIFTAAEAESVVNDFFVNILNAQR